MGKKRDDKSSTGDAGFGGLGSALADLGFAASPTAEADDVDKAPPPNATPDDAQLDRWLAKARPQEERKGRGGKTVTVLKGLSLDADAAAALAKYAGRKLGCRGFVEDGEVVLSGAQKMRLHDLLHS